MKFLKKTLPWLPLLFIISLAFADTTALRNKATEVGSTSGTRIQVQEGLEEAADLIDDIEAVTYDSWTQGAILYGTGANTTAKLAKSTTSTHALLNTGTSNNPAWGQVPLTSGVTGVLPHANGGTTSGEYTPTVTNVTNIASSSAGSAFWIRAGNFVSVAGSITFDPTAVGYSALTITLPVTVNNFTNTQEASGVCNADKGAATVGSMIASSVAGATTVRINGYATYSDNTNHRYAFTYKVIN